jgi:hypothetical protein
MNSAWLKIGPEALYWGPRNVAKAWNASEIYITENGCSAVRFLRTSRLLVLLDIPCR